MSDAASPSDLVLPPRRIDAYREHDHLETRRHERQSPTITDYVIRRLLAEGRRQHQGTNADHGETRIAGERWAFDLEIGGHDWRLIVVVSPAPGPHVLLSCYCPCHDERFEDCGVGR